MSGEGSYWSRSLILTAKENSRWIAVLCVGGFQQSVLCEVGMEGGEEGVMDSCV